MDSPTSQINLLLSPDNPADNGAEYAESEVDNVVKVTDGFRAPEDTGNDNDGGLETSDHETSDDNAKGTPQRHAPGPIPLACVEECDSIRKAVNDELTNLANKYSVSIDHLRRMMCLLPLLSDRRPTVGNAFNGYQHVHQAKHAAKGLKPAAVAIEFNALKQQMRESDPAGAIEWENNLKKASVEATRVKLEKKGCLPKIGSTMKKIARSAQREMEQWAMFNVHTVMFMTSGKVTVSGMKANCVIFGSKPGKYWYKKKFPDNNGGEDMFQHILRYQGQHDDAIDALTGKGIDTWKRDFCSGMVGNHLRRLSDAHPQAKEVPQWINDKNRIPWTLLVSRLADLHLRLVGLPTTQEFPGFHKGGNTKQFGNSDQWQNLTRYFFQKPCTVKLESWTNDEMALDGDEMLNVPIIVDRLGVPIRFARDAVTPNKSRSTSRGATLHATNCRNVSSSHKDDNGNNINNGDANDNVDDDADSTRQEHGQSRAKPVKKTTGSRHHISPPPVPCNNKDVTNNNGSHPQHHRG